MSKPFWSQDEIDILYEMRNHNPEIIHEMIPRRSIPAIRRKLLRCAVSGFHEAKGAWSPKDIALLVNNKDLPLSQLSEILDTDIPRIRRKMVQLGIKPAGNAGTKWSAKEIAILKRHRKKTAEEIRKYLPNRTILAIYKKRNKLKNKLL